MSPVDFERLRGADPDCPSDLTIDEFVAGELSGERAAVVETHVAGCARCRELVEQRRAGFDAVEGVDPRSLLAGIRRKLDEPVESTWRRALRAWLGDWRKSWAPLGAAAVAVVLVMVALPSVDPGLDDGGVRRKGGLILHVFRTTESGSSEALSGDSFRPGDRLRFVVDLPFAGHVSVLGQEPGGTLYTAWPLSDAETLHEAGPRQELPGAVALDDAPGPEILFLVHCSPEAGPPRCESRGAGKAPACQGGCATTAFVVQKELR